MKKGLLGFMLVVASSCVLAQSAESSLQAPCSREQTLACLKRNFHLMQNNNYSLFWDIIHVSAREARRCESSDSVAQFLSLVKQGRGNAEFEEFFSETIEQIAIHQGGCLLSALAICDEDTREAIIQRLATPVFMASDEIDRLFLAAKTEERYQPMSELYFTYRGKSQNP